MYWLHWGKEQYAIEYTADGIYGWLVVRVLCPGNIYVTSVRVPTCDNLHSWQLNSAPSLGNNPTGTHSQEGRRAFNSFGHPVWSNGWHPYAGISVTLS